MEISFDFAHFQINMDDNFQLVSDDMIWYFLSEAPFAILFGAAFGGGPTALGYIGLGWGCVTSFLRHGALYFPMVPGGWVGLNNKNRLVTQIITQGWRKKSFTFQDDLGLRFYISRGWSGDSEDHKGEWFSKIFIDAGVRFEKNFTRKFKTKLFLQTGQASF